MSHAWLIALYAVGGHIFTTADTQQRIPSTMVVTAYCCLSLITGQSKCEWQSL